MLLAYRLNVYYLLRTVLYFDGRYLSYNTTIMQFIQNKKSKGSLLPTSQLMAFLLLWSVFSCVQGGAGKPYITISVDKSKIIGKEKTAVTFHNNSEKNRATISFNKLRLCATIVDEQGGVGSELIYADQAGKEIKQPCIDACLRELIQDQQQLQGQESSTINLGVAPGIDVTSLTIRLQLFEIDYDEPMLTETITWVIVPKKGVITMEITDFQAPQSKGNGYFKLKNNHSKPIDPEKLTVQLAGEEGFVFHFIKQTDPTATLADLLNIHTPIDPGAEIAQIQFKLHQKPSHKPKRTSSHITVYGLMNGELVFEQDMIWRKKKKSKKNQPQE